MSEFDRDPRRAVIEAAFIDRSLLATAADAVRSVLTDLDAGRLRVARPPAEPDGEWHVEGWVQQAVVLAFGLFEVRAIEGGDLIWQDKLPPKRLTLDDRVRAVPPGVARFGSHLEPGVVLMPGFVNIGAYVGSGTMIDTWATVGSCAQIGRDVHLAGGGRHRRCARAPRCAAGHHRGRCLSGVPMHRGRGGPRRARSGAGGQRRPDGEHPHRRRHGADGAYSQGATCRRGASSFRAHARRSFPPVPGRCRARSSSGNAVRAPIERRV
jgi:hypothetical protein